MTGEFQVRYTDAARDDLIRTPFIFRKAGQSPLRRELLVPFRGGGYVVLYDIENGTTLTILAVRHQLEDDYH